MRTHGGVSSAHACLRASVRGTLDSCGAEDMARAAGARRAAAVRSGVLLLSTAAEPTQPSTPAHALASRSARIASDKATMANDTRTVSVTK